MNDPIDDSIKKLRDNPMYRQALKMAASDGERRKIISTVEGFIRSWNGLFSAVGSKIQADPKFASQFRDAMINGRVIKERSGQQIEEHDDSGTSINDNENVPLQKSDD